MNKQVLAVVFGGQSSEHEVSCKSVINIVKNINPEKYEIILIGITKQGKWLLADSVDRIKDGSWVNGRTRAIISPDAYEQAVVIEEEKKVYAKHVDVVFPVLHGRYGEDGTIQGLCELAHIPYVGCGVLASAVSMDKVYTKLIVSHLGIDMAPSLVVFDDQVREHMPETVDRIEAAWEYPVFVKPASEGSSCGVTRADNREMLEKGLLLAADYDRKILVEKMIRGREVECAVLGGRKTQPQASGVGEILSASQFYDYDAKYNNPQSETITDPDIAPETVERVRQCAVSIFRAVNGFGMSRVDFFIEDDGTVVFNEINTIPGFTDISMYPMLWEKAGLSGEELVQTLINLAFER